MFIYMPTYRLYFSSSLYKRLDNSWYRFENISDFFFNLSPCIYSTLSQFFQIDFAPHLFFEFFFPLHSKSDLCDSSNDYGNLLQSENLMLCFMQRCDINFNSWTAMLLTGPDHQKIGVSMSKTECLSMMPTLSVCSGILLTLPDYTYLQTVVLFVEISQSS